MSTTNGVKTEYPYLMDSRWRGYWSIEPDIMAFAAGVPQADDVTLLALQYKGKSGSVR